MKTLATILLALATMSLSSSTAAQSVGERYCVAPITSTGELALIYGEGSASISTDDFTLLCYPVYAGANGLFYYGPEQAQLPFCVSHRCVAAGGVGTFRLPVISSDGGGVASHTVDFDSPPEPAGTITPGLTWNFQYYLRDPLGDPCSWFLSDGLKVTFTP